MASVGSWTAAIPRHRQGHQAVLIRTGGRVGLGEDVAHVIADGLDADEKFLSDLPVCLAAADEAQDFDCAPRF